MRTKGNFWKTMIIHEMVKRGISSEKIDKVREEVIFPDNLRVLGTSTKVEHGEEIGVLTAIVYLSPSIASVPYGGKNLCPFASTGCAQACLGKKSFRLRARSGRNAQLWKTLLWIYLPHVFRVKLAIEIGKHVKKAEKKGLRPAIRLNGTSDIMWEKHFEYIFDMFPMVQFYDYTKIPSRISADLPKNYHLTFSRSEDNEEQALIEIENGGTAAAVFENLEKAIKEGYRGKEVINADLHDFRPADKKGTWAGLSVKGNAKDTTGFIVNNS